MDVTTAPHNPSDSNRLGAIRSAAAAPSDRSMAPIRRITPLRHGLSMGVATAASMAVSFCCILSVANRLSPHRPLLNAILATVCGIAGIYVGIRSWQSAKIAKPSAAGRCLDCGRELSDTDDACSLCGRKVSRPISS